MSSLRTLLTCGALERRRPETVHGALTRSSSNDFINMSMLCRQYTKVCESELPNVPKSDLLVSKISFGILNDTTNPSLRMIFVQQINKAISKTNFCIEKPFSWSARLARAFCAVIVI